jgi:hypothetical protein
VVQKRINFEKHCYKKEIELFQGIMILICFNSVDVCSHARLLKYTYIGMTMANLNQLKMSKIKGTLNSRNAS